MRITIFFFVLLLSVEVTANDNDELTLFSISDSALNVPYDKTTKWVIAFVPEPSISVKAIDKTVSSKTYFSQQGLCRSSRVILTGGNFENDEKGLRPVGFHMNLGEKITSTAPWVFGGYIYQTKNGNVDFSTIKQGLPEGVVEALQSKPFLIEKGGVAVAEGNDPALDRIAIGNAVYNDKTGLIVVAAISDLSRRRAIRLHHFAEAIVLIAELYNIKIDIVLNLDGAAKAFVCFPKRGKYYGTRARRYIPSVICIN